MERDAMIEVAEARLAIRADDVRSLARALTYKARLLVVRSMEDRLIDMAPDVQSAMVETIVAIVLETAAAESRPGAGGAVVRES